MNFKCLSAIFLLSCLLIANSLYAQKYAKTLLWKIEGNGLTKPSYMYGTMHLFNKELFYFGDSVYQAMENTEGFALELDINELSAYQITHAFDNADNDTENLEDMMSESEKYKYGDLLRRKFKKQLKDITRRDILRDKNKWLDDYIKKGDMQTIVDVHLYNIANGLGKYTTGIEDIEDQMSLVTEVDIKNSIASEETRTLKDMINIYKSENLDAIDTFFTTDSLTKEHLLIKRNHKMARRMDSLSAIRSMFFAVGAAHLPGKEGLIELLEERGFTVSPVISSKKVAPESYAYTPAKKTWHSLTDQDSLFSIQMPGKPSKAKLMDVIDIYCHLDLTTTRVYFIMALPVGSSANKDSLYSVIAKRMLRTNSVKKGDRVVTDNMQGMEYSGAMDGIKTRIQLFIKGNILYCLYVGALKEPFLYDKESNEYFASLKLYEVKEATGNLYTITDSAYAFSITSPVRLELNEQLMRQAAKIEGGDNWKFKYYTGRSMADGSYVAYFHKRAAPGYYLHEDSLMHSEIKALVEGMSYTAHARTIDISGTNAMEIKGYSEGVLKMKLHSMIRGNSQLIVMAVADSAIITGPGMTTLFSSYRFLPYKKAGWSIQSDENKTFSAYVPAGIMNDIDSSWHATDISYNSYDSFSSTTYYVFTDTMNKYVYIKDDSSFLAKEASAYINDEDSALIIKYTGSSAPTLEKLLKKAGGRTYTRLKARTKGDVIYIQVAYGEEDIVTNADADKFFNSFASYHKQDFDPHKNKTALLITDLYSTDSATRKLAFDAINQLEPGKEDLPAVHKAMFDNYLKVYENGNQYDINEALLRQIQETADVTTVTYIKEQFAKNATEHPTLARASFRALASIKTKESYDAFVQLAQVKAVDSVDDYSTRYYMKDSIKLLAATYPALSSLFTDTTWGPFVADMALTLSDSGLLSNTELAKIEPALIKLANQLKRGIAHNEEVYYYASLIELLARCNSTSANAAISDFQQAKNTYITQKAVLALIKNNQPASNTALSNIASELHYRAELYNELKEINKLSLFPTRYMTQKDMAEGFLYSNLSIEDEMPDSMVLMTTKTLSTDKGKYRFYYYKLLYNSEPPSAYLGVYGGYSNSKDIEPVKAFTYTYWEEEYSKGLESILQDDIISSFNQMKEEYE